MNSLLPILLLPLFFLSLSCASTEKRIQKNQEVFRQFPPEAQDRIRDGEVAIGDSKDMVRIAKGEPQTITTRETRETKSEIWRWTRPQQYVYPLPVHTTGSGIPSPQFVDAIQFRESEILRIEFLDGKVVVIEEMQEE